MLWLGNYSKSVLLLFSIFFFQFDGVGTHPKISASVTRYYTRILQKMKEIWPENLYNLRAFSYKNKVGWNQLSDNTTRKKEYMYNATQIFFSIYLFDSK